MTKNRETYIREKYLFSECIQTEKSELLFKKK